MADLFEKKNLKPMLIGKSSEPFDSPDFIYELKLDGIRCIAYLDRSDSTDLRDERNRSLIAKAPGLSELHLQAGARCILDGELIALADGRPDISEIQRLLTTSVWESEAALPPASFVAFDILYLNGEDLTGPAGPTLMQRKRLLQNTIIENARLAVSRYIEERGMEFYELAKQQKLDGIIAKRRNSAYFPDSRTADWIKIQGHQVEDFVICGYEQTDNSTVSVVLGQYRDRALFYKGRVTLDGASGDFQRLRDIPRLSVPPFAIVPSGFDNTLWLKPMLVCTVKYTSKTKTGYMREPVFEGIQLDKTPEECTG